jgi:ribulose-phosphate 3-epimerase
MPVPSFSSTIQLAPSLLSADAGRLAEAAAVVEAAGADLLHVDVMDGQFVPNLSFGPQVVAALRRATTLPLDVHLMVQEPLGLLDAFIDAGADVLTVHWEAVRHLERVLDHIHQHNRLAGIALNPATPVSLLSDIWAECDWLLIMSVNPGFSGQQFWPRALHKIEAARQRRAGLARPRIVVDGGVDRDTAGPLARAGADVLVSGSYVFDGNEPAIRLRDLRQAVFGSARIDEAHSSGDGTPR